MNDVFFPCLGNQLDKPRLFWLAAHEYIYTCHICVIVVSVLMRNKPGLIWRRICDKPLSKPMVTKFSDTHYNDVIMGAMASQITSLTVVYSAVYSDVDQRKHRSSASLAFVRGIHR